VANPRTRSRTGIIAYDALMTIRESAMQPRRGARHLRGAFRDLGFAYLLLKRYVDDPREATPEQIAMAAEDTVPGVAPLFWAFRIMVGLGFAFIG
jgi:cytochrome d ubiquinol oxidase subunit I